MDLYGVAYGNNRWKARTRTFILIKLDQLNQVSSRL